VRELVTRLGLDTPQPPHPPQPPQPKDAP